LLKAGAVSGIEVDTDGIEVDTEVSSREPALLMVALFW
jgi:hypothetical protein